MSCFFSFIYSSVPSFPSLPFLFSLLSLPPFISLTSSSSSLSLLYVHFFSSFLLPFFFPSSSIFSLTHFFLTSLIYLPLLYSALSPFLTPPPHLNLLIHMDGVRQSSVVEGKVEVDTSPRIVGLRDTTGDKTVLDASV